MRKVYEEYKIINVNEIEGVRFNTKNDRIKEAIYRAKINILKYGIRSPFEVIKRRNKYKITGGSIHFIAAKELGYEVVPCLVRNRLYEGILNKIFEEIT